MAVRILKSLTDSTPLQTEEDMPEIIELHEQAMKTEFTWPFFGGTITTNSGHKYQVVDED
jgi:hypothetical protein